MKQTKAFNVLKTSAVLSNTAATNFEKQNQQFVKDNRHLHAMLSSAQSDNAKLLHDNAALATQISSLKRANKKLFTECEQYKSQLESLNISSTSVQLSIHSRSPLQLPGNRPAARN